MNLKLENIFKNFFVHNIIGHPTMQILKTLGYHDAGEYIHDKTLPEKTECTTKEVSEDTVIDQEKE